jgi:hypothetical protein
MTERSGSATSCQNLTLAPQTDRNTNIAASKAENLGPDFAHSPGCGFLNLSPKQTRAQNHARCLCFLQIPTSIITKTPGKTIQVGSGTGPKPSLMRS